MNYTNPYFNNYQPNMQYGNQFYQSQQMQQPIQQRMQLEQFVNNKPITLQGKIVDNVDVVKATDIPLDRKC